MKYAQTIEKDIKINHNTHMIFGLGVLGGIILVAGAAWPAHAIENPLKSPKNWLLALGGLMMLIFSSLDFYFNQAPFFFILLQLLVSVASVLMMAKAGDKWSTIILTLSAALLVAWSLLIFEDQSTIFFILGLLGIGIGYALEGGTVRRNIALMIGSVLIAYFSYLGQSWIFFWLNAFFALFSAWYVYKLSRC